MKVLLTGVAGFIGFHVAKRLLERGDTIIGIDNLNDYYDVALKHGRLKMLQELEGFDFFKVDIADRVTVEKLFVEQRPQRVINLAAQAGVRYGIVNPHAYIQTNILGFLNVLEGCRHHNIEHLVYASTSSVYGANTDLPFSTSQNTDHPLSLYGATKKSNELMAHSYSYLYQLPTTGLRFFTVYGPWGRPDMALFTFTRNILAGEPIEIFNNGDHARDFTFIDDIVTAVVRVLDIVPTSDPNWNSAKPDPSTSSAPYRLYNVGNNQPIELMYFIECLEKALGRSALKNFLPLQPGDVPRTYADVDSLVREIGAIPDTRIEDGIKRFVDWYLGYYNDDGPQRTSDPLSALPI